MKKVISLILALVLLLAITGCGASASYDLATTETMTTSSFSKSSNGYYSDSASSAGGWSEEYYEVAEAEYASSDSVTTSQISENVSDNKNVKLIYTANMSLQTTDFQQTYQSLVALVEANGGYFESSNVENGNYFSDGSYMYGYYTVRVPSENYGTFVNAVGSSCHVVNLSESVEDVGLEYFEIESRLETLKIKEERLHELLSEAATMSDIIDLENALSDCEYEIDQYTSSLNRYDSLVNYSTINIDIEKVTVYTPAVQEELTFGQRMEQAFVNGAENFRMGCEDFAVWCSGNVFTILLILIIILVVLAIRSAFRRWLNNTCASDRRAAKKARKAAAKAANKARKAAKRGNGPEVYSAPAPAETPAEENNQE